MRAEIITDELASMTLIRALPDNYNAFLSSLLLKDDLDKAAVQNAFAHEDNQCRRRQEESPSIGTALAVSSGPSLSGHRVCWKRKCSLYILLTYSS